MGCTVRSHLRWSRRWESVMSLTPCPWKARSVTLSPCPWESRGVTPSRAQPRVPRARHQQLLHLPLIPRLHSTFAAPTSAGPHCLSGSRRTKNAGSRPLTSATGWRTACSMGQNPAAVVPVLLPLARRRLCGGVHAKGKLTSCSGEQLTRRWGATVSCHPNCPTTCGWRSGQPAKHPAHPARRSASVGCSQHARTPTP